MQVQYVVSCRSSPNRRDQREREGEGGGGGGGGGEDDLLLSKQALLKCLNSSKRTLQNRNQLNDVGSASSSNHVTVVISIK